MKLRTISWAVFCIALVFGALAYPPQTSAKNLDLSGFIRTYNKTPYKAWITIYDIGKTRHMDYGMLDPGTARHWDNCCYVLGSYYHVRAEVKKLVDGKEQTIFDTSIRITPHLCSYRYKQESYPFAAVELRKGSGDTFYWEADSNECGGR